MKIVTKNQMNVMNVNNVINYEMQFLAQGFAVVILLSWFVFDLIEGD